MTPRDRQIVIVGNGGAGLSAIRAIRSIDRSSSITLLSSEACFAYSPVATTHYIAGEISRDQLFITDETFYREHNVRILLKKKVLEIRPEQTSLVIAGKETVPYDELLIATGASPVSPTGDPEGRVLSLRTLEDAERIRTVLPRCSKAVVLGGGLVGLQLAQTLWKQGLEITVVVGSDRVLSRNVDLETSLWVQREMESKGISVHLGKEAVFLEKSRGRVHVHLNSGETLSAPIVLRGKGVKPNLFQGPLSADGDMAVDDRMRTRLEKVYAAGDVSRVRHFISGKREHLANWPNACYQGWVAGLNMAGVESQSEGLLNQNVTHLFGLQLASIGVFKPPFEEGTEVLRWSDESQRVYRKIVLNQGKMIGAVLVNRIEEIGLIRRLIVRGVDLSGEKSTIANSPFSRFLYRVAKRW